MNAAPRMSAIIVHYRAEKYLEHCLDTLAVKGSAVSLETIVVDNGSLTDGRRWEQTYPGVRWVFSATNGGFSAGVNAGAQLARGEYLLVLNPDAWPLGRCLEELAAFLDTNPAAAAVSPQLVSLDGTPQSTGGAAPTLWRLLFGKASRTVALLAAGRAGTNAAVRENRAIAVDWASATALLCRRRAWDQVGGLDDGFFLYYEDCDLGLRLRQRGWGVYVLTIAQAAHVGGASFGADREMQRRAYRAGQDRYFRKHRPVLERRLLAILRPVYERFGLHGALDGGSRG